MLDLYTTVFKDSKDFFLVIPTCLVGLALKKVSNVKIKQWVSTTFGLFLYWHFFQKDFLFLFLSTVFTIVTIVSAGPKRCHLVSTVVSLSCLNIFRLMNNNVELEKFKIMIIMMNFSAKLMTVAIDMHFTHKYKMLKENVDKFIDFNGLEHDYNTEPSFMDLFHFSFCHIGVLPAICYRFRTYNDYLNGTFSKNSEYIKTSLTIITKISVLFGIYVVLQKEVFPLSYLTTEEFANRSIWYKSMYGVIQGNMYRLVMSFVYPIGNLICATSGLGAYPAIGANKPGHGPTKHYKEIMNMTKIEAESQKYDFQTITNLNLYGDLKTPWIRKAVTGWNMTSQYVFFIIYHAMKTSDGIVNKYAFIFTMTIDLLWHGTNKTYSMTAVYVIVLMLATRYHWRIYTHLTGRIRDIYAVMTWIFRHYFTGMFLFFFLLYHQEDFFWYLQLTNYVSIWILLLYFTVGYAVSNILSRNKNIKKNY